MARKLGDVAIALIVLTFVVGAFSALFNMAHNYAGIDTGVVGDSLSSLNNNLSKTKTLESDFTTKTDTTGTFTVEEDAQQIEDRGSDSAGVLNLISKNILVQFLNKVEEKVPGFSVIKWFLVSLIGVTISILMLRFFWGESKI